MRTCIHTYTPIVRVHVCAVLRCRYLLSLADREGWIPVTGMLAFPRMIALQVSASEFVHVAAACDCVEVDGTGQLIRRLLHVDRIPAG
jgi:hypothetical protein